MEFAEKIHSLDAERSVVGCVLLQPNVLPDVEYLRPDDFYDQKCKVIWKAFLALRAEGEAIEILTVLETLKAKKADEQVGGLMFLVQLFESVYSVSLIVSHAKIVKEYSSRRKSLFCADILKKAILEGKGIELTISRTHESLMSILGDSVSDDYIVAKDLVKATNRDIEKTYNGEIGYTPSGFFDIDAKIIGFGNGDFIILAGRPSMGKTSMAMCIGQNVAKGGKGVAIFSLEMKNTQLMKRMIAASGLVNTQTLNSGKLTEFDFPKYYRGCEYNSNLPIYFYDTSNTNISIITAKCMKLKRTKGLGFVIIDYLQLLGSTGRQENRNQEVGSISRSIKLMAMDLEIPVLVLSQLNRKVEERSDKRPKLSDLRDSGNLEQDADMVLFVYRPEVYKPGERDGIAEIIIAKNRNGDVAEVNLGFQKEYTRFNDLTGIKE